MKRIIIQVLFVLMICAECSTVMGQQAGNGDLYFKGSLEEAMVNARIRGRFMLLEFYAPWSHKSRWNNTHTLADERVRRVLDDQFVVYQVDVQQEQGASLAASYGVTSYPNMVVFSPYGNALLMIDKNMEAPEMIEVLNEVTQSRKLNAGRGFTAGQLIEVAEKFGPHAESTLSAIRNFLTATPIITLTSAENWELMKNQATMYYRSPVYDFVLSNRARLNTLVGEEAVAQALTGAVEPTLVQMAIGTSAYDSTAMAEISALKLESTARWIELATARHRNDVDRYVELVEEMLADPTADRLSFSVVLSLDFVASSPRTSRALRQQVLKILNAEIRKTISPAKLTLLDKLRTEFKNKQ